MANRALGVGFGFNNIVEPPSISRQIDDPKQLLAKGKLLLGSCAKSAIDAGKYFCEARPHFGYAQWHTALKEQGLAPRTVNWAMHKYQNRDRTCIADLLNEPAPKKGDGEREPGDDTPKFLSPLDKAEKSILKCITRCSHHYQIGHGHAQGLKARLSELVAEVRNLTNFPEKPKQAARPSRCRDCGASILWAESDLTRKPIALDFEPGGGSYDLIDGTAVKAEWTREMNDRLYRCHFVTCPIKKKQREEAINGRAASDSSDSEADAQLYPMGSESP